MFRFISELFRQHSTVTPRTETLHREPCWLFHSPFSFTYLIWFGTLKPQKEIHYHFRCDGSRKGCGNWFPRGQSMPNWYIMIKKYQNIRVWRFENGFGMRVKETEKRACVSMSACTELQLNSPEVRFPQY